MGTDRTLPSAKADYEIRNDGSVSIIFSRGSPLTFPSIAESLAYLRKAGFKDIADRLEADPLADMPIEAPPGRRPMDPRMPWEWMPSAEKAPVRETVWEPEPEPEPEPVINLRPTDVDSQNPWTTLYTVLGDLYTKGEISDDVYYEAYAEVLRQEARIPSMPNSEELAAAAAQGILDRIHTEEWLQDRRDVVDIRNDNRASQKFEEAIIDVLDSELARQKAAALGMDTQLGNLDAAQEYIDARKIIWRDEFREWYETGSEGLEGFALRDFQDKAPQLWLNTMIQWGGLPPTGEDHPYFVGLDLSGLDNLTIDQLMSGWFASLQARGIAVREQKSRRDTIRDRLQTAITTFKKSAANEDYDGDPALKRLFTEASNFFKAMLENGAKEDALIDRGLDATGTALEADMLITNTMSTLFGDRFGDQIVPGSPSQSYLNIARAAVKSSVDKDAYRANIATTAEKFRAWSKSSDFAGNPELQDAFLSIAQSLEARSAPGSQVSLKGLDSDIISETDTLKVIKDLLKPFPTYANMITDGQLALSLETIEAATVPDPRVEAAKLAEGEEDSYRANMNATAEQFRTWAGSAVYAGNPKLQAAFLSIAQSLEAKGLPGSTVDLQGRDADTVSQEDALAALKEGLANFPQYLERNLVEGQLQATLQLMGAETARLPGQEEEEFLRQELEEIERAKLEAAAEDVSLFDRQGIVTVRDASGRIVSRDAAPGDRQQVKADRAAKTQSLLPDFLGKLGLSAQDIEAALNEGFTGEPDKTPPGTAFMASLTSGEIEFDASAKTMIAKLSPRLGEVTGIARNVGYSEEEINTLAEQVAKATEGEYGDVPGTIREQLDIVTARDVELDDLAMDLEEEFVGLTGGGGELNALLGSLRARRAKAQEEGDLGIVQELTKNIQFIQKNMPTPAGKPQQTGVTVSTTAMGQPIAGTERQFVTAEAARQRPATPLAMARQQIVERQQQGLDPYSFSPEEIEARVMRDAAAQDRTAQLSEIQAAQANELERQQRIGARAQARADYQAAALKPEKKKQPTANLQGRRVSR